MKRFTVTEEHIKLLRNAYVRWEDCEFGAPSIDCKRPYGNSDVIHDMREILGEGAERCPNCGEHIGGAEDRNYHRLHEETETALQIVLATGSFEPGEYVADAYSTNWRPAGQEEA